jgi:hypothetical protein
MPPERSEEINKPNFVSPEIAKEAGEIRRVAEEVFGDRDAENFLSRFMEAAKTAPLTELSEDMWSQLENTDSYGIPPQDWSLVEEHAVAGHSSNSRDWQLLKARYEQGATIEAPMVLKANGILHLVSGNTRLMVARALGITPKVLLVEFSGN